MRERYGKRRERERERERETARAGEGEAERRGEGSETVRRTEREREWMLVERTRQAEGVTECETRNTAVHYERDARPCPAPVSREREMEGRREGRRQLPRKEMRDAGEGGRLAG